MVCHVLHDSAVVAACCEDMATPEAASSAEETSSHFSQQDLDFCRQLPRVELHAHLNGCVQLQTLRCCVCRKRVICHASFGFAPRVFLLYSNSLPVNTCVRVAYLQATGAGAGPLSDATAGRCAGIHG